jgi:hypothetical protein
VRRLGHHYDVPSHDAHDAPKHKLSAELLRLSVICEEENVTFSRLIRALRSRGHALITLFLSFPFLLPVPLPGLSVIFGLLIALCGVRISFQGRPWIPRKWRKKRIPGTVLAKVFRAGRKVMLFLEKFIRPRQVKWARHREMIRFSGWMIAILGVLLSLPYPPGTNFPPASAIILLSIGLLEEDVLFLFLGMIDFVFNLFFFTAITFFGFEGIRKVFTYFY